MRFLSTKRHSRAAKPVLLLLALVLVGCVYAFVSPSASGQADTNASTQVAQGKEIFQQNCSSCHGLNGEGTTQGPSLAGVGAAAGSVAGCRVSYFCKARSTSLACRGLSR